MAKKVKIKSKKPQGIGSKIFDVVNYLLLAILGFIMFYPMFYVFIAVSYTHLTLPTNSLV